MKVRYVFYILLLVICAFIPLEQSSSTNILLLSSPCIRITDWTVGRTTGYGDRLQIGGSSETSFITNSEKTCCVQVSISYCEYQPGHIGYVYPITDFDFEVTMNNGFTEVTKTENMSGPDAALKSPDTSFTVSVKFEGPPDTETVKICDKLNGRLNIPMIVTVRFIGYYGTDPNDQNTVELEKEWTQVPIDMCRQEYVDLTPPDDRAQLPVPDYSSFCANDLI